MASISFLSAPFLCALLLVAACGIPLSSLMAADSLLQTFPTLPGESGPPDNVGGLPKFLQPLSEAATAPGNLSQSNATRADQGWVGDSWVWNSDQTNGFERVRIPTAAEEDFALLERWRQRFLRLSLVILACAAIALLAVVIAVAARQPLAAGRGEGHAGPARLRGH